MICDAVKGISGHEQESICVPWCDDNLETEVRFKGFYKTYITCGSDTTSFICDARPMTKLGIWVASIKAYMPT